MLKLRSGVVLFITLATIISITALLMATFIYINKMQSENQKLNAYIQSMLYYKQAPKLIADTVSQLGNNLISQDLIVVDDGKLEMSCRPLVDAVPIAWLDVQKQESNPAQYKMATHIFDTISSSYNISNPRLLLDMIQQRLSSNYINQNRLASSSKETIDIKKIVKEYCGRADDYKSCDIEWDKFFSPYTSDKISSNYISDELVTILFQIPLDVVKQKRNKTESLLQFINNNGGNKSYYDEALLRANNTEKLKCQGRFSYVDNEYKFLFLYSNKKVMNFEFIKSN